MATRQESPLLTVLSEDWDFEEDVVLELGAGMNKHKSEGASAVACC